MAGPWDVLHVCIARSLPSVPPNPSPPSCVQTAVILPLASPAAFARLGISAPSGVLLHGPPGCGKTMLAEAIAHSLASNFIHVSAPMLLSSTVGDSERALAQIFHQASC